MFSFGKVMAPIKKILRFFGFFLLGIFILINFFIVLSGKYYIYKGIRYTYLSGKTGPGIYDLNVFPYSTIPRSNHPEEWKKSNSFNAYKLSESDKRFMKSLDTRAFLVFKDDSLLYENYYGSHHLHTISNSFSAAKTVVALLIGAAIDDGYIKSVDEPVGKYISSFNSGGKEKITIRHLLLMSSGLDWEESASNPLSDNAESYYGDDLYGLVSRQKAIDEPGKTFVYQSGNSQLLGFIIEQATRQSLSHYAYKKIWKRIGAEHKAHWSLDRKNGNEKAFCCLYATARDFGKLGKLILQEGAWNNAQLIPKRYMKKMTTPSGISTEEGIKNFRYGWHVWTYKNGKYNAIYCRGIKGQYIIALPEKNVVIVRLGMRRKDNYEVTNEQKKNVSFMRQAQYKIGHPTDFFEFLRIGQDIANHYTIQK